MGFSRQECWSGLQCPPPGDLPNPGIEPVSLMSPALAGGFFTTGTNWEALQPLQDEPNHLFLECLSLTSVMFLPSQLSERPCPDHPTQTKPPPPSLYLVS